MTNTTIDNVATKQLYLTFCSIKNEDSGLLNFRNNLLQIKAPLNEYFEPLGIDPMKCQNVSVIEIDPYKQQVMYYGEYPLIGTVSVDAEMVLNDPDFCPSEETTFGLELNYSIDEQNSEMCLLISISARFPWLYRDVPIQIPKYINKTVLPDVKQSKLYREDKENEKIESDQSV